ncbi:hypothetical protein [Halomonas sp. BN3-1]|uniref:hypothetical protein n=1 Tax=Halomonas sp. BN3-1 TaxID=2082393 RepID=UPI0013B3881B|nr:hypothetical protein [Halomonas sp. BN3-1]|tara:strand:+ start:10132 stop:11118 length:987 start_codon:yes stop_codon:yes gene_type:complete
MNTAIELPLDSDFVATHAPDDVRARLQQIVRSLRFTWEESSLLFRILGPDTGYHAADPNLLAFLKEQNPPMHLSDLFNYRSQRAYYDLCFEDCWSGYFIAGSLNKCDSNIILIHLDDHTDMMPTFLTDTGSGLINPATRRSFDPQCPDDWAAAINAGCVSIGDFITPLLYSNRKVHIRHLNNAPITEDRTFQILRAACAYPEIPGYRFASIKKVGPEAKHSDGSYLEGSDPEKLLSQLPSGKIILHIDLDYFINDFNGNIGAPSPSPASLHEMRRLAQLKMCRFFSIIKPLALHLERCIIATSPGFCSASHWKWLLEQLEDGLVACRP